MIDDDKKRNEIIAGFYTLVTKKVNVSIYDPNFILIEEALENLSVPQLQEFFKYYAEDSRYFNKDGFTTVFLFKKALRDYIDSQKNSLWDQYGIGEKVDALALSIISVYASVKHLYADELSARCKSMEQNFNKIKNAESREPVFTPEDQIVIEKCGGLYKLFGIYGTDGIVVLKEHLADKYKDVLYMKHSVDNSLKLDHKQRSSPDNTAVSNIQNERGGKQVLSLLGEVARKM